MTKLRRPLAGLIAFVVAAASTGCGDGIVLPDEGEAASIQVLGGDEQSGPAGVKLAQAIAVRVVDTRDRPVQGQEVTFSIQSGGGEVAPLKVTTDAQGRAAADWTLGPTAGGQEAIAQTRGGGSAGTLTAAFTATAVAGAGSVLEKLSGDGQTGPVNSALAESLVVRVTDALGNPVAGVEVAWSVGGGGSINPATVASGSDGRAAAERVLGPSSGPQVALAEVSGFVGSPISFTHTAEPANPTVLLKVSGDGQSAPAGFEVAEDLVVRLEDDNGNGIGARPITWVVPSGAGSVTPVNAVTDPNGFAATRWTLPSTVGSYNVSAVFSGLPSVPFSATATADAPTAIEIVSGDNQSGAVGADLADPLVVRVTDASDNPVEGVSVAWTAEGGGSVSSPTSATNASGLAQITRSLGLTPGPYTTTASVDGLAGSPITFNSTATVGPPAKLAIITQPGSTTAISGQALAPQPVIEVQDALGNPVLVAGRAVAASITSSPGDPTGPGTATLTNAIDNTGANGRTSYSGLRITGPPGDYVLTFSSGALTPVVAASITLQAGAANRIVIVQQPSTSAQNGVAFTQQPIVRVEDGSGNPVTGNRNIQVSIASGGGTLGGTTTVSTGGGSTATFTDLRITGQTGDRTLLFASGGLTSAESNSITITAGSASKLAIITQPGTTTASSGEALVPQPVVEVQDASGNPVEQAGVAVTASIASGDAGATLSNASANTAANGRASFAGLAINGLTGPYVLRFATGALTQINANSITLTAGPAASIEFSAGGSSGNAGDEVTPDPAVIVKDASGNPVEGVPVQFQVTSAEGTVDPTTPVITGPDGIATVTSWILGPTPSTENTLTATVNGLSGSVLFTITTGP